MAEIRIAGYNPSNRPAPKHTPDEMYDILMGIVKHGYIDPTKVSAPKEIILMITSNNYVFNNCKRAAITARAEGLGLEKQNSAAEKAYEIADRSGAAAAEFGYHGSAAKFFDEAAFMATSFRFAPELIKAAREKRTKEMKLFLR